MSQGVKYEIVYRNFKIDRKVPVSKDVIDLQFKMEPFNQRKNNWRHLAACNLITEALPNYHKINLYYCSLQFYSGAFTLWKSPLSYSAVFRQQMEKCLESNLYSVEFVSS